MKGFQDFFIKRPALLPIILLVVIIGFTVKNNDKTEIIKLNIDETGFSLKEVNIIVGSTVVWKNTGEKKHWPASNFHPSHDLYPEGGGCLGSKFDACRGLEKEETFSFQFNKVGSWPVHDHLFPASNMIVNVKEKGSSINNNNSKIVNTKLLISDFREISYSEQLKFIEALSKEDPAKAWAYTKEAFLINGQVVGNAHEFAHIIGNESYKKSGLNGIKICDVTFAFGCFHGVTEAMLLKEGPGKIKEIELGCFEIFPPSKSNGHSGCIHGTGHGIYTWESGDLSKSLKDCDSISEIYREYCYDGVFMENSNQVKISEAESGDIWKNCEILNVRYHRSCARYQSQIFISSNRDHDSFKSTGAKCELGPTTLMKETCYQSLGFYAAQSSLGKREELENKCGKIQNRRGNDICLKGGAIESVFQRYKDYQTNSRYLCEKIAVSLQLSCIAEIERLMN